LNVEIRGPEEKEGKIRIEAITGDWETVVGRRGTGKEAEERTSF